MPKRPTSKGLDIAQEAEPLAPIDEGMIESLKASAPFIAPELRGGVTTDDLEAIMPVEPVETAELPAAPNVRVPINSAKIAAVASKIYKVSDVTNKYLTILGYGKNKTGKTTFGATASRALFINVEDGLKSVRRSKAQGYDINTWDDLEALYWFLASQPGGKHPDIDTLVWDTLTRLLRVALRNAVLGAAASDTSKDVIHATQRDWGVATDKYIFWISMFKKLPYHQIWLCQERTTSDDVDVAGYEGFPDLSKALRNYILGDADVIGRFEKRMNLEEGNVDFVFNVAPSDIYLTGDRLNVLGTGMVNPSFDTILRLFKEAK